MGGEPWCFTPAAIAGLTDWQVYSLYLKPAADRAAKLKSGGVAPDPPTDGGPARSGATWEYLTKTCGLSPDEAERVLTRG